MVYIVQKLELAAFGQLVVILRAPPPCRRPPFWEALWFRGVVVGGSGFWEALWFRGVVVGGSGGSKQELRRLKIVLKMSSGGSEEFKNELRRLEISQT